MILIYGLFEIMATFVESYFSFRFIDLFVAQNIQKKKCVIMSAILTGIICIINLFNLSSIATLIIAILYVPILIRCIFKVPFFDAFSITAFFSFFVVFVDFFSMAIMGFLLGKNGFAAEIVVSPSGYRCAFLLLSKILLIIVYFAVRRLLFHLDRLKSRNLLLITGLGYFGVCYYAKFTFEKIDFNIVVNWFVLFTIVILSFFSLIAYIRYQKEAEEKKLIEIRNHVIADSYMELTKSYQENAQLYHNMKHHLLVLQELFKSKKYPEMGIYLNSLYEVMAVLEYTWTGDKIIDCILNNKKIVCEQLGIHIIIDADPVGVELDGVLVSTIMSNLLDNAIEACQKFENGAPYIKVAVRHINDMLFVKIQNPASNLSVLENSILQTTKDNKNKEHGWGLKSVESAVKKVGGVFRYSCIKGEFVSVVTLFL